MGLRRTALARKSELRRGTPMPRGKRELKARAARTIGRSKSTGPTPALRNLVLERADGCCELCGGRLHHPDGGWVAEHSFHHRQARGMGGTRRSELNEPSNLLLVCGSGTTGCHGFIETHRRSAEGEGWLVRHGEDPAQVPVTVHGGLLARASGFGAIRVLLTADGEYQEVPA